MVYIQSKNVLGLATDPPVYAIEDTNCRDNYGIVAELADSRRSSDERHQGQTEGFQ